MCFQMANSVAQLGFGHIADRWRPRVLLIAGPLVGVTVLPLIGLAPTPWMLAAVLVLGGLGGAAFHPPAAALVHRLSAAHSGLAMSFHITGGSLGFSLGPLIFAPFVQRYGLRATPLLMVPALAVLGASCCRACPPIERLQEPHGAGGFSALRPYAQAADAALSHRRAAHADGAELRDVHAGDADAARHDGRGSGHRRGDLSVRDRARRVLRRPARRSLRAAARHHVVAGAVGAVSGLRADCCPAGRSWPSLASADSCCSPRCR